MGKFTDRIGRRKQAEQGKISVRLLEFAQPMIDQASEREGTPDPDQMRSLLKIAVTIWNATIMMQVGRGSSYVEEIERLLLDDPGTPPEIKGMVKLMLARKADVFPNDLRLVADFEVFQNARGEFRLRAEARLPKELMDEH